MTPRPQVGRWAIGLVIGAGALGIGLGLWTFRLVAGG